MIGEYRWVAAGLVGAWLGCVAAEASADRARDCPNEPSASTLAPESVQTIDDAVLAAIARREVPGAVVVVLAEGQVVYRKAHGLRVITPNPIPMTLDTVFDLASLTKPMATALALMRLRQQHVLSLTMSLASVLPACAGTAVGKATLEQLLLHTSGLPAADALSSYDADRLGRLRRLCALPLATPPGTEFRYSDLGYILLGEAIAEATARPLDRALHDLVFAPLGLRETGFNPTDEFASRAAPTEAESAADGGRARPGEPSLAGRVHDPRARRLGGVAGHAGVFATADDVARFVAALIEPSEARTSGLSRETIRAFLAPRAAGSRTRAYAGHVDGDLIGHTGFTGTGFWVDPRRRRGVVILTTRLYPNGQGTVGRLRRDVIMAAMSARLRRGEDACTRPSRGPERATRTDPCHEARGPDTKHACHDFDAGYRG
jgi:CubicO group peptidase (beta-lactamase class C family)